MELLGKLRSNDTSNIGMIPSASKYVSVNFSEQCLHIISKNDTFNGLKGITKMINIQYQFKFDFIFYKI